MESSIYRYILKHTLKAQILLIVLTVASMPFVYISLEIPKIIINQAIGGQNIPDQILGMPIDQVAYLLILCFVFLALIAINGGIKYFLNVYRGVVGERMLRRFRYELYSRILRFPLHHFKRTSPGEIIPMVTAETEPLGGFIGDAFALPAFQGGLLLTYLFFIFNQDIVLGIAAVALYPPQMYLIPKLQRKINELAKQRVSTVRKLADRVGESVSGITEIHAHDATRFERADIADRLGKIFSIRYAIYRRKFFIKFMNNFLAQLTPFFFYSMGGYFVIKGELSLGALVAVLAAYKDLASPWKELLKFYQISEDVRVKYAQIIDQFQPAAMLDLSLINDAPETIEPLTGTLVSTNLSYSEDDVTKAVDGASFRLNLQSAVGVVGAGGSGRDELGLLLARLIRPTSGRLIIDEQNLAEMPEAILGRRMAYVGPSAHIFTGTIRDNLFYGLKRQPVISPDHQKEKASRRQLELKEAKASDNSMDDIAANWIDYQAAGVADEAQLTARALEILKVTALDDDIYHLGLFGTVDPEHRPNLTSRILEARRALRDRLEDPDIAHLVESFDKDSYNENMTVAENLLFGTSVDHSFDIDNLPTNSKVLGVLKATGLYDDFLRMGHRLAEVMIDLFADVPADSDLFEQYSFISADDLPSFTSLLSRSDPENVHTLSDDDRKMLLSLPFKLIPARHRLGLINESMQERLLTARKTLIDEIGEHNAMVNFFDPANYHAAISIQDNILFGKQTYGKAHAQTRIGELISETVAKLDLREEIIRAGLDYEVGIAGARLSLAQRQKLAIARCLLKRPDVLVVNDSTGGLDPATENRLLDSLIEHMDGKGLIWMLGRAELASRFQHILVLDSGRVVEQGTYEELQGNGKVFSQLLEAN